VAGQTLGHHSPAFTLSTYVHLLTNSLGQPLALDAEIGDGVATGWQPNPQEPGDIETLPPLPETFDLQGRAEPSEVQQGRDPRS
jgi:hypothetical protein